MSSTSPSIQTKRQFSHLRLIILLITALNTLDIKINSAIYYEHFQSDLNYCGKCFATQLEECHNFLQRISDNDDASIWNQFLQFLPQRSCKRHNQFLAIIETKENVVAKYFATTKEHLKWFIDCKGLKNNFLHRDNLDGMQFYPLPKLEEFIAAIHLNHPALPEVTLWLYLSLNIQPILLPVLYELKFPVPKTYAVCGFTVFQEYGGLDLYHFYNKDFTTKLQIAKQLLEASLKFSYGFGNYRLYITDLTADNIVYDQKKQKLSFIDLDTIFVVDFREAKYQSSIHKHEPIECPGCFAYSPDDIALYNLSDINIYSACQFLLEDLYRDKTKGFLYPIPTDVSKNYSGLWETLNTCLECPPLSCSQRFTVAEDLLNVFESILNELKKS